MRRHCILDTMKNIQEDRISNGRSNGPNKNDGPRANERITVDVVRVIGAEGENIGELTTEQAIALAYEAGLDLVEISPNVKPPVCKILDLGKYKYEMQKKANLARKKQKVIEVKEIKMRPSIDVHDYNVKMKKVFEFLEDGDKVKLTIRFKGREMAHPELGNDVLNRIIKDVDEVAKIESKPALEGRQMIMVIAPK